jgi:hypothetical protein
MGNFVGDALGTPRRERPVRSIHKRQNGYCNSYALDEQFFVT